MWDSVTVKVNRKPFREQVGLRAVLEGHMDLIHKSAPAELQWSTGHGPHLAGPFLAWPFFTAKPNQRWIEVQQVRQKLPKASMELSLQVKKKKGQILVI